MTHEPMCIAGLDESFRPWCHDIRSKLPTEKAGAKDIQQFADSFTRFWSAEEMFIGELYRQMTKNIRKDLPIRVLLKDSNKRMQV